MTILKSENRPGAQSFNPGHHAKYAQSDKGCCFPHFREGPIVLEGSQICINKG